MGVVSRARVAMVEERRTGHGPSDPVEREVVLRMRAERRLVEQQRTVRWVLLAGAVGCAACGLAMLIAGSVVAGWSAFGAAAGFLARLLPRAGDADGPS